MAQWGTSQNSRAPVRGFVVEVSTYLAGAAYSFVLVKTG